MHLDPILSFLAAIGPAMGVLWYLRGYIQRLVNNSRLIAENDSLREENGRLKFALEAANSSVEAWQGRVKSMDATLEEIKTELGDALIYIVQLVTFLKSGGNNKDMPPIPDSLQEAFERASSRTA